MRKLLFEKVSDVNSIYPYVCVYFNEVRGDSLMEIAISDRKEIEFNIYPLKEKLQFTFDEWAEIAKFALDFLPNAIKDEEDFLRAYPEFSAAPINKA